MRGRQEKPVHACLSVTLATQLQPCTCTNCGAYTNIVSKAKKQVPQCLPVQCALLFAAALSGRGEEASSFRPSPLNTFCWFHLEEGSKGTLQFPLASEGAALEGAEVATGTVAPTEGLPVHKIAGRIQYRDRREELSSIKNDPSAVRDVVVAKFVDYQGRASAEMVSVHQHLATNAPVISNASLLT